MTPNSLNYTDAVERIERDHQCDVINIAEKEEDFEKHKSALENKFSDILKSENNLVLANAPRNLKECYLLRNNKIIPSKVLLIYDDYDNMVNYYHKVKGVDLTESRYMAENEAK